MLKILQILFLIIAVAFFACFLFAKDSDFIAYMFIISGLSMLVNGLIEFKKNKKILGWVLVVVFILSVLVAILLMQMNKTESNEQTAPLVNPNIITSQNFEVSATSNNLTTSAQGTIFVKDDRSLQIVSSFVIDSNDWGGLAFYIPNGWRISNIFTSYPEQQKDVTPIHIWHSTNGLWDAMIEVGRNREYKATKGGSGTIIIDLTPPSHASSVNEVLINVEVGSSNEEGVKKMGTDFIEIPISFGQK